MDLRGSTFHFSLIASDGTWVFAEQQMDDVTKTEESEASQERNEELACHFLTFTVSSTMNSSRKVKNFGPSSVNADLHYTVLFLWRLSDDTLYKRPSMWRFGKWVLQEVQHENASTRNALKIRQFLGRIGIVV